MYILALYAYFNCCVYLEGWTKCYFVDLRTVASERCNGLMVSMLESKSKGPGSTPYTPDHCIVFWDKTLNSHSTEECLSPPRSTCIRGLQ